MVTGNTETLIAVTYDDADGTLDFVVAESSISHDAIADVSTSDHHTKYTDAEAATKIAADDLYVKIAGDIIAGDIVMDNDTQTEYKNTNGDFGGTIRAFETSGREIIIIEGGNGVLSDARVQIHGAADSAPGVVIFGAISLDAIDDAGSLMYATNAAGAQAKLAVGTATQVLAVNSGATAPEWVDAPTGASFSELMLIGA
jgi:hypothetical protein